MSASNRTPRDREHAYFEDDDEERGVDGQGYRNQRPGERDLREGERFGERHTDEEPRRRDPRDLEDWQRPWQIGE
jgi:hypothetical protein